MLETQALMFALLAFKVSEKPVANQWECPLNLQEKLSNARSANESTKMEAFASIIHEQGKVDQTLSLETFWGCL